MVVEYIKQELATFSDFIKWLGAVNAPYFLYDGARCYAYGTFNERVTMIYYVDYKFPDNPQFVKYTVLKNSFEFVDHPDASEHVVTIAIIYIKELCLVV